MRKGQAAIEYLTTYGWALLALVIVFAALFASGALTPNYLVSQECTFGTNFQCQSALFDQGSASKLNIQFFNGFPYKVKIDSVTVVSEDGTRQVSWTPDLSSGVELESGTNTTLYGTLSGSKLPSGAIERFYGNITYVSCAPELGGCTDSTHTITGRITAKVIGQ